MKPSYILLVAAAVAVVAVLLWPTDPDTSPAHDATTSTNTSEAAVDHTESPRSAGSANSLSAGDANTADTATATVNAVTGTDNEPQAEPPNNDLINQPAFQQRLDAMQARRSNRRFDAQEVAAAVKRDSAWQPADEIPRSLPLKPEEFTDGRRFIRFDEVKMESLMPGDQMTVALEEHGRQYTVQIDSVQVHDSSRISWFGHLVDLGETYSVNFTRGEFLTVGGLDTPEGHFVLQAHGPSGWIASSALLFKVDPHTTDAIVPPEEH